CPLPAIGSVIAGSLRHFVAVSCNSRLISQGSLRHSTRMQILPIASKKMPKRQRAGLCLAIALFAYMAAGLSGGCSAYRRPPGLSKEERQLLLASPLPYGVAV